MKIYFDLDNSKNVQYELYQHINRILSDRDIHIKHRGEVTTFPLNFQPQRSGTMTQQQTYKSDFINKVVNQIINLNK